VSSLHRKVPVKTHGSDDSCQHSKQGENGNSIVNSKHKTVVQVGSSPEQSDSAPLLRSGESPPRVLHPDLQPPAQERHGPVEAGLEKGHENDPRAGAPHL